MVHLRRTRLLPLDDLLAVYGFCVTVPRARVWIGVCADTVRAIGTRSHPPPSQGPHKTFKRDECQRSFNNPQMRSLHSPHPLTEGSVRWDVTRREIR